MKVREVVKTIQFNCKIRQQSGATTTIFKRVMNRSAKFLALCAIFAAGAANADEVTFQNGLNGYEGARDTYIIGSSPELTEKNFADSSTLIISGVPWGGQKSMALIRFENLVGEKANQIPPGSAVVSAQLQLHKLKDTPKDQGQYKKAGGMSAFSLLTPFDERAACFSYRAYSKELPTYWGSANKLENGPCPKVDYIPEHRTEAPLCSGKENVWMSWDITKMVAEWLKSPQANNGVYLYNQAFWCGATFDSAEASEKANRPKLVIKFTPSSNLNVRATRYRGAGQGEQMTLLDEKTLPCIIAPASPTPAEAFAIKELRAYLEKITGKSIPVGSADSAPTTPAIVVGSHPLNKSLGAETLGPDEYVIDVSKNLVRIAGGSKKPITDSKGVTHVGERGTLYGVYEILETLGVRWYRPDPWGEHVPRLQAISLPTGVKIYRPAYKYRYGVFGYRWWRDETKEQRDMGVLWAVRNRQNVVRDVPEYGGTCYISFGHNYMYLIPVGRYFASHPEYFALIGGKRSGKVGSQETQLCLSNPDVQRLFAEAIVAQAKANPQTEIISVEPNDFSLWCECDGCKAMDDPKLSGAFGGVSMANRVCAFNNIVARRVAEQAPHVKIGWLAYNKHTEVPTLVKKLEPNTVVQATAFAGAYSDYSRNLNDPASMQNARFLKILEGYGRLTQIMVHDYFSGYAWCGPLPIVHTMTDRLRAYRHHNVIGVYSEMHQHWGPQGLELYFYGKLLWNPDLDVNKELALYYENYYGPAAKPMKEYHELLEKAATNGTYFNSGGSNIEKLFTDELLNKLSGPVKEAQQAVRGMQPYEKRLEGVVAGYEVARRTRQFFSLANANRIEEALRCFDELEKYILSFKEGDVFDNGPIAYPNQFGYYMREWKKPLASQAALMAVFRNPKIEQEHNKQWRFQIDPRNEGLSAGWMNPDFDTSVWPLLDADRWWQEQGYPSYHGAAWYRRQFHPPAVNENQRVAIYFGAVDGDAAVFVNGKKVGEHLLLPNGVGWDKPFSFDITDELQKGKVNLIAVRVRKESAMSGIFKGVKIISADELRRVE